MPFLVCFYCLQVFTSDEGHNCPHRDRKKNESNASNALLVPAKSDNVRSSSIRTAFTHGENDASNPWFERKETSTGKDFLFTVVASEPENKMTDRPNRKNYNDVLGSHEVAEADNFHPMEPASRNDSEGSFMSTTSVHSFRQLEEGIGYASSQGPDFTEFQEIIQQTAHPFQPISREGISFVPTQRAHSKKYRTLQQDTVHSSHEITGEKGRQNDLAGITKFVENIVTPASKNRICEKSGEYLLSESSAHDDCVLSHSDPSPHKCDVCGNEFQTEFILKRHYLIHTEEKPFVCSVCDFATKWSENLKIHLKSKKHRTPRVWKKHGDLLSSGVGIF